ncbi:MAG: siderophore-interacting protein [Burkholderiales bacterium]|jgi:NADPH-dependent ferric siderophore reductase|nr:siderophore-interacting protein [Burkholderiales bacterium]MBP7521215.1 siderophore-interacting protein [Leptothrix sp. (in: b-proteobacteria)]HQY08642.1 siderophore-interacting protein [Burkholderiaceae bacterium]
MNLLQSPRRIQRVRREVRLRRATVQAVQRLSPNFVAVTFGGEDFADFVSDGFDDHIKVIFSESAGERVMRDYTPRRFDAARRELTLEFALHEHGPASDWARQARVGQSLVIGGPRGSMIIPTDDDWHLLVADASALPALHRRVEELPTGARVHSLVLLDDPADRRDLLQGRPSAIDLQAQWFDQPAALLEALRSLPLPAGEGFAWAAGEASLAADWRRVLLQEKGHPLEASKIASYWKRGAADFHEPR